MPDAAPGRWSAPAGVVCASCTRAGGWPKWSRCGLESYGGVPEGDMRREQPCGRPNAASGRSSRALAQVQLDFAASSYAIFDGVMLWNYGQGRRRLAGLFQHAQPASAASSRDRLLGGPCLDWPCARLEQINGRFSGGSIRASEVQKGILCKGPCVHGEDVLRCKPLLLCDLTAIIVFAG